MDLINKTSVIKKYQNGGSNELDPAVITDSFTGKGKIKELRRQRRQARRDNRQLRRDLKSYDYITDQSIINDFITRIENSESAKTYNDSAITQAFMGYVPDSTAGLGPVPTVTFVGQSPGLVKGIGPMSSGQFFNVPSILKQGGNIPNYFRLLKNK